MTPTTVRPAETPVVRMPEPLAALVEGYSPESEAELTEILLDPGRATRRRLDGSPATAEFRETLGAALAVRPHAVLVDHPAETPVRAAMLVLGHLLGGVPVRSEPPITPAVTTVKPMDGAQTWHCDASPWRRAPRWSVLGMLSEDPEQKDLPTRVIPVDHLVEEWDDDPEHLTVLRTVPVAWRQRRDVFAGAAPVLAPVLSPRGNRWNGILTVRELAEDNDTPIGRACRAFDRAVRACTHWYSPVVRPGRLMVSDNHRTVHSAPVVTLPSSRVLALARIDGVPD